MLEREYEHPNKLIEELRLLAKKVFVEPTIITKCLEITREHYNDDDATRVISEQISANTNIKIPFNPSEADQMFVELLIEIVKDEKALY